MASNYEKAHKIIRDYGAVYGAERMLVKAGVLASLAVADEVRMLREELSGAKVLVVETSDEELTRLT